MDMNQLLGGLPSPGDFTQFGKPGAGDDSLFVVFYMGVLQNDARTAEQGRPIFDDVECIRIIVPGDKNTMVDRPVQPRDKQRFAKQYGMFKQGVKEEDQITGTRLSDWPLVGRARGEELKHLGIRTVEQLAEVRDEVCTRVPGLQSLKQSASIWLAKARTTAEASKAAKMIDDQANRISALEQVVRDQAERLERALAAQKAA